MTENTYWLSPSDPVLSYLAEKFDKDLPYGTARELRARVEGTLDEKREHLRRLVAELYLFPVGEGHFRLSIRGLLENSRGAVNRAFVEKILRRLVGKESSEPGYSSISCAEFVEDDNYLKSTLRDDGPRFIHGILQMMNLTDGGFPNIPGSWNLGHEMLERILEAKTTDGVLGLFAQVAATSRDRMEAKAREHQETRVTRHEDGSAPPLIALHPRVVSVVEPLWRVETLSNAVEQASKLISKVAGECSGRIDDGGVPMLQELLKPAPPDAKSGRLHLGELKGRVAQDRQDGLRSVAVGVQLAIRNVAAHGSLAVQTFAEAYEQLCMISWILRQFDKTTLVPYEPLEDDDGE